MRIRCADPVIRLSMGETNSLQGNPRGEGRGWKTQNKLEIEFLERQEVGEKG